MPLGTTAIGFFSCWSCQSCISVSPRTSFSACWPKALTASVRSNARNNITSSDGLLRGTFQISIKCEIRTRQQLGHENDLSGVHRKMLDYVIDRFEHRQIP